MKVIIGGEQTGKTTILLHYVYNEIEKLQTAHQNAMMNGPPSKLKTEVGSEAAALQNQTPPIACLITSKRRMNEAQMIFGIYCEV